MSQHESAAKLDMAAAGALAAVGTTGVTFHDFLEYWQLGASAVATTIGAGYVLWKWWKDYRWSRRRDRRQTDK